MGPRGRLARAPVRSHQCGSGGGGTNGPMCSQTLLRARCWEKGCRSSFSQRLPRREERGTQSNFTRTADTEISVYRCTFGLDRNALYYTHLRIVESMLRLFPLSLSLMEHARWESLIKGIQGSHLSIPHDLPAPVKVTYRLQCLQFALLLMQSWPLRSDVLFKVVNDYHLSVCFSCRTGIPPLLHLKDFFCVCLGFVLTSSDRPGRHELICCI